MFFENRRFERYRTCIRVRVQVRGRDYDGFVLDISQGGMRLSTEQVADVWSGDDVRVECEELGLVTGEVRWRSPGRFGIRFDESTNTTAKFEHFRKHLGPVM